MIEIEPLKVLALLQRLEEKRVLVMHPHPLQRQLLDLARVCCVPWTSRREPRRDLHVLETGQRRRRIFGAPEVSAPGYGGQDSRGEDNGAQTAGGREEGGEESKSDVLMQRTDGDVDGGRTPLEHFDEQL